MVFGRCGVCCFTVCVLFTLGASSIHFTNHSTSPRVCFYGDETHPKLIDQTSAEDGEEPLTYILAGSSDYMIVNASSGYVYINCSAMSNVSHSGVLTFRKHAVDVRGAEAHQEISVKVEEAREFREQCPKTLYFNVRQIAPVGEEIGVVECRKRTHFNGSSTRTHYRKVLLSEGPYVPFDITEEGVIVVTSDLVFYNSIYDITMFSMVITGDILYDGTENCTRITTIVTTVITVKETGCQSKWTYSVTENLYIDVKPLAVGIRWSLSECMENCTWWKSSMCNSIVYNVLTDTCYILNDTVRTQPNKTRTRMGYFYYRKMCHTELLPSLPLRKLAEQVSQVKAGADRTEVVEDLVEVVGALGNEARDVVKSISTLHDIVRLPSPPSLEYRQCRAFIKAVCRCIQLLFRVLQRDGMADIHTVSALRLCEIFDELAAFISRLTVMDQDSPELSENMTSLQIVNTGLKDVSTTPVLTHVINGRSGVTLRKLPRDCKVAVGVLEIADGLTISGNLIQSPVLPDNSDSLYRLSSHVVTVSSTPHVSGLMEVSLDIFTETIEDFQGGRRICAFLLANKSIGSVPMWDTAGCTMVGYNKTHTQCVCSHLTNFAVLMQVRSFELSDVHEISLGLVTKIGCCISIAALATSLIVLFWLRLQSDRYVLLMNLNVAIILAQVVFLTGIDAVTNKAMCRVVAISLHYLYLAVFTLMLAQGIHLYHKLYRAFAVDTNLTMFLILGWGSPFAIISISVMTNLEGYGTNERCWLSTKGAIWAFVGPALTVISINMAILIMIIRTFLGVKFNANKSDVDKFKASVRATVVLLPLLGITWLFGVAAVNGSTVVFQYVFAILNSLQGLFIFLCHVVLNEEVREACTRYKGRVITIISNVTPQVTGLDRTCRSKKTVYSNPPCKREFGRKDR